MDYANLLTIALNFLPYLLVVIAFFTLIPKSVKRIKATAKANIEDNRYKYHRCYGPDICCHLNDENFSDVILRKPYEKSRKIIRRGGGGLIKGQKNEIPSSMKISLSNKYFNTRRANQRNDDDEPIEVIKRQVQASAIQTQTNVNQIARMFETGGATSAAINVSIAPALAGVKRINRVQPTNIKIPDIKTEDTETLLTKKIHQNYQFFNNNNKSRNNSIVMNSKLNHLLDQDQENIENSINLLNHADYANLSLLRTKAKDEEIVKNSENMQFTSDSSTSSTASPGILSSSPISTPPLSPTAVHTLVLTEDDDPSVLLNSKIDDLYAAIAKNAEHENDNDNENLFRGCKTLSPVTSIDDILAERRLSRPLSAYSISDLLNEESPNPVMTESLC